MCPGSLKAAGFLSTQPHPCSLKSLMTLQTCSSVLLQFLAGPPELLVGTAQGAPGPAAAKSGCLWKTAMLGPCMPRLKVPGGCGCGQAGGPGWQGYVGGRVSHGPWALRASVSRFWGVLELSNLWGSWTEREVLRVWVFAGKISSSLQ